MKNRKEPWQIAAARYCVENSEEGFTKAGLEAFIKLSYSVTGNKIEQFWNEEIFLPSGRKFSREHSAGNWIPPLDLVSKVTDYDELKEARENARSAFIISIMALGISTVTLLVSFIK